MWFDNKMRCVHLSKKTRWDVCTSTFLPFVYFSWFRATNNVHVRIESFRFPNICVFEGQLEISLLILYVSVWDNAYKSFLQVPYYLAELTEKIAQDDRIQVVKASQAKLKVFVVLCRSRSSKFTWNKISRVFVHYMFFYSFCVFNYCFQVPSLVAIEFCGLLL